MMLPNIGAAKPSVALGQAVLVVATWWLVPYAGTRLYWWIHVRIVLVCVTWLYDLIQQVCIVVVILWRKEKVWSLYHSEKRRISLPSLVEMPWRTTTCDQRDKMSVTYVRLVLEVNMYSFVCYWYTCCTTCGWKTDCIVCTIIIMQFITDRPSSRVLAPPGGGSSISLGWWTWI